jgi:hypothetical protein
VVEGEVMMEGKLLVRTTKKRCAPVPLVHSLSQQSQTKNEKK